MASRLTPVSTSLVCDDPRLIDAAEQLLGGPVIPECPEGVLYFSEAGWHTDDGIGVRGLKFAAYFDELTAGTGALRLVPGSHHPEQNARLSAWQLARYMARLAKNGGPHSGVRRRPPPRHHGRRLARQTAAPTASAPNAATRRWRTASTSIPTAPSAPASSSRERGINPAADSRCSSARALARSKPCPRSSDDATLACCRSKPRSTCSSPTYPWPSCSDSARASFITARASADSRSHMPLT